MVLWPPFSHAHTNYEMMQWMENVKLNMIGQMTALRIRTVKCFLGPFKRANPHRPIFMKSSGPHGILRLKISGILHWLTSPDCHSTFNILGRPYSARLVRPSESSITRPNLFTSLIQIERHFSKPVGLSRYPDSWRDFRCWLQQKLITCFRQ